MEKPVPSPRRSRAVRGALKRERRSSVRRLELAHHARRVARRRGPADLRQAAQKAAETRSGER